MDSFQQNNPPNNSGNNKCNNNGNNPKKGKGRKKTPTHKIEKETNRQVTFSKRRSGLFKKASELSTLCGAGVSVIAFSPSNKAHSFGSPNVDAVARRFSNQTSHGITSPNQSQNNTITRQHNQDLTAQGSQLEELKKHKKEVDKEKKAYQPSLEDLSIEQLNETMEFMLNFKNAYEANVNGDESSKGSKGSRGLPTIDPCGDQVWGYQPVQVQQPEYNNMDYHFQNNGYMYGDIRPSGLNRTFNYPASQFDVGSSSNANAVFPNNSQTFFIDPLDPTGNNIGYPYPNPNEASGSNLMLPYNYGIPNDSVPDDNDNEGAGTGEGEEE